MASTGYLAGQVLMTEMSGLCHKARFLTSGYALVQVLNINLACAYRMHHMNRLGGVNCQES
jgi:hypothetical protein